MASDFDQGFPTTLNLDTDCQAIAEVFNALFWLKKTLKKVSTV